jgi:transcriptional regulator with XRE-family HTH domain
MLVNRLPELIKQHQKKHKNPNTKKPYTEAEIAALAGIDKTTFSRYKNGLIGSVDLTVWQRLADFFGVDGSEIFNVSPKKEGNQ